MSAKIFIKKPVERISEMAHEIIHRTFPQSLAEVPGFFDGLFGTKGDRDDIVLSLPGVSPEAVDVSYDPDSGVVHIKVRVDEKDEAHRFFSGDYRKFVGTELEPDDFEVSMANGELSVHVKEKEKVDKSFDLTINS